MGNHKKNQIRKFSEDLTSRLLPKKELSEKIPLSLIIPVFNCSEVIGLTLESVQQQDYQPLEVIVIDAGSTDRTLEIINSYSPMISRTYTVSTYNMAEMINRGIALASGHYHMVVLPGTYYISEWTYFSFAEQVLKSGFPDLVYCGSIQREIKRNPKKILLPFNSQLLEKGLNPATLPACWFRYDLFEKIGKLNTNYIVRAGLDLFCRVVKEEQVEAVMIDRVFIDFDYGRFSYGKILRYAKETWSIICDHFGTRKALRWFLTLNHFIILRGFWHRFKLHLSKR